MTASSRDAILSRVRHAIGGRVHDEARREVVAMRLAEAPAGVIPARGQRPRAELLELFCTMAGRASASVTRIAGYDGVPEAVAEWLRAANLPATLRLGADPRLAALDFSATALQLSHGASSGDDLNGLSHADGGIAETGTLMLLSGADNPTSLNFLPENHIVLVHADDVVGDMEALWPRLRARFGKGLMPRSVNFVTGPSRSADIEQTLLLGAHGPRALHVILIGD
ncbi:LutC/YkgG family protein [Mangrovibrevibacter kandeliae]|uniref:LutC/YkgG family protein n=1 Tax=Mangrovibrevibacter kandeliae TaxID=2968473 RepID=UPI0021193A3E|nr:lactate utilization protein [Aurantimonas sp. CSK15Z-1]MCQ8780797.1 lactate utilization protein [Aurantimonas sp. CSK15Z-1]